MSTTTTGRIVGALFLFAFVVYLAGGALVDSATGTADVLSEVADNKTQVGVGALLMLANSAAVVGIGVLVFPILRRHDEVSAHAYLVTRVFEAVVLAVGVLFLLLLVPLAQEYADAGSVDGSALPSVARVANEANQYSMQIAMIGLGLGSILFCQVLLRAGLVPKPLAMLGLVGYVVLAAGEALGVLGYGFGQVHYAPGGVFEVALGVLLIVKGFPAGQSRDSEGSAPNVASPLARPGTPSL